MVVLMEEGRRGGADSFPGRVHTLLTNQISLKGHTQVGMAGALAISSLVYYTDPEEC